MTNLTLFNSWDLWLES